jgi:hypothetical protein
MTDSRRAQGLLDTDIIILRGWIDPDDLPDEMAISAVTLAELSAGPHLVRSADEDRAGGVLAAVHHESRWLCRVGGPDSGRAREAACCCVSLGDGRIGLSVTPFPVAGRA